MKVKVLAVGPKMPNWVSEAVSEYTKRMPKDISVSFVPLALGARGKSSSIQRAMEQEGDVMLSHIKTGDHVVALDLSGKPWDTPQLAIQLQGWRELGKDLILLIGGPDGLDARCLSRANQRWALSNLTLPHPLVRVLLSEQLYRAWSITQNHPYHK